MVEPLTPEPVPLRRDLLYSQRPVQGVLAWNRLPIVLDTSMLLNDIVTAARGHGGSLLLSAAEKNYAHLYATDRVRVEVEGHLEERAKSGHVSVERAFSVWRDRYLSYIRFVRVEDAPRGTAVTALAERDPGDLPTGMLAELLAPCLVFARDNDLIDCGIARKEWMTLVHNAEHADQLELIFNGSTTAILIFGALGIEGVRLVVDLARAFPLPTVALGTLVALLLHSHVTSERGRRQVSTTKDTLKEIGAHTVDLLEVGLAAQGVISSAAFVLETEPTELAHAARTVAVAATPPSARQVAAAMNVSVQKAASLLRNPIFEHTVDRCYLLGRSFTAIDGSART